jgi:hypothetical protein
VFFGDSSSAVQNMISFQPNKSFSVSLDNFTLKRLKAFESISYEYKVFESLSDNTILAAEYQFSMRSRIGMVFFNTSVKKLLRRHIHTFLASI